MKDKPEYVNLQVKLYDEKQQYAIIVFHVLVEKEEDDNRYECDKVDRSRLIKPISLLRTEIALRE